jgi:INO80 complex subunit C
MPPKGKRKAPTAATTPAGGTPAPEDFSGVDSPAFGRVPEPSISLQYSYLDVPKPFKNPYYSKHIKRRAKTMKILLNGERERIRLERERRKAVKDANGENIMEVDGADDTRSPEDVENDEALESTYIALTAPPSILPTPHYCDITGLDGPYTDPATRLRYHDHNVYQTVKALVSLCYLLSLTC